MAKQIYIINGNVPGSYNQVHQEDNINIKYVGLELQRIGYVS